MRTRADDYEKNIQIQNLALHIKFFCLYKFYYCILLVEQCFSTSVQKQHHFGLFFTLVFKISVPQAQKGWKPLF
jgi:hypothetical protein